MDAEEDSTHARAATPPGFRGCMDARRTHGMALLEDRRDGLDVEKRIETFTLAAVDDTVVIVVVVIVVIAANATTTTTTTIGVFVDHRSGGAVQRSDAEQECRHVAHFGRLVVLPREELTCDRHLFSGRRRRQRWWLFGGGGGSDTTITMGRVGDNGRHAGE